jgi:hypothetical protein
MLCMGSRSIGTASGRMAIEHNYEEPKRTQIRQLLKQHGYENVHTYRRDDFYAPAAAR